MPPGTPIDGRFDAEVEWLRRCHARGATIATACSGALLLAESGLLDGNEATTHWAYCDTIRARYPKVKLHPQRALVVSGDGQRLVMAGGGTFVARPRPVPDRARGRRRSGDADGTSET